MSRHPMSASADYENMLSAVQASGASRRQKVSAAYQKDMDELLATQWSLANQIAAAVMGEDDSLFIQGCAPPPPLWRSPMSGNRVG